MHAHGHAAHSHSHSYSQLQPRAERFDCASPVSLDDDEMRGGTPTEGQATGSGLHEHEVEGIKTFYIQVSPTAVCFSAYGTTPIELHWSVLTVGLGLGGLVWGGIVGAWWGAFLS